ncbi:putative KHDC1-like protein [Trichechus inunguis]
MAARTRRETALTENSWWTMPENFVAPLVFYMDEELEERIFGPWDADLRCIEEHSHTLIQLEQWFSASGQTRVTIVGPIRARQWLLAMALSLGCSEFELQAQGLEMLQHIRSQALTDQVLNSFPILQPYFEDLVGGRVSLLDSQASSLIVGSQASLVSPKSPPKWYLY